MYIIPAATVNPIYVPICGIKENRANSILGMHNNTMSNRNMLVVVYSSANPRLKNRNLMKKPTITVKGIHQIHRHIDVKLM